jgi:hypothetical protein
MMRVVGYGLAEVHGVELCDVVVDEWENVVS